MSKLCLAFCLVVICGVVQGCSRSGEWHFYSACLSPDGRQVALGMTRHSAGGRLSDMSVVLELSTRQVTYRKADSQEYDEPVEWSPDGQHLLVHRLAASIVDIVPDRMGLFIVDPVYDECEKATPSFGDSLLDAAGWLPGGREVVYTVIERVPASAGEHISCVYRASSERTVKPLAKGARLLAVRDRPGTSRFALFLVRRLSEHRNAISILGLPERTERRLMVVPTDYGGFLAAVSPGGKYLAAKLPMQGRLGVVALRAVGSPAQTLVTVPPRVRQLSWSADAALLACSGTEGVWVYDRHTKSSWQAATDSPSVRCLWLPGGSGLLVVTRDDLRLVDVRTHRATVVCRVRDVL